MKKVLSIIALSAMTLSLSSFNSSSADDSQERDCMSEAWEAGSNAEEMGASPSEVYSVTNFVYTACDAGIDYMLLMIKF